MAIDNRQLARKLIDEVWNKGKLELIDELVDPGYEGRDPMMGTATRNGLKESVKAYRAAFPDLKLEVSTILSDGSYVCTRWTAKGTHLGPFLGMAPTGKHTVVTGLNLAEFRNGRIVADVAEYDALGLTRQLGVEPQALPLPVTRPVAATGKRL